jgi:hypothetical protein
LGDGVADIQIKRKTSVTITETFMVDGVPLNLDSGVPVVVATAPDSTTTTLAASGAWDGRTTGQYRVVLAGQSEVTWRDLAWTGTIGGQPQTLESRVEWLGALLFPLDDLRRYQMPGSASTPFEDPVKYPDAELHKARAATLARFTKALNVSLVPRFAREVISVGYGGAVLLEHLPVTKVLSVTAGGVAQVAANFYVAPGGRLLPVSNYLASPWVAYGYGSVAVEYEHGWPGVDDDGRDAALKYAASRLNPSAFTSGTSYTTPDGVSVTYEPGAKWATGIREVDRWLNLAGSASVGVGVG